MGLRDRLLLLTLLGGLILASCQSGSEPGATNSPGLQVASLTAPVETQFRSEVHLPAASPGLQPAARIAESQLSADSSPTPTPVEQPLIQNSSSVEVCSPLAGIALAELAEIISAPYAPPPPGKEDRHHGIDFAYYRRGEQLSIQGTGVQAVLPGVVVMALEDSFPYGNVVIVESSLAVIPEAGLNLLDAAERESLYVLYAHLESRPQAQTGQEVAACQPLGTVGMSGNAGVAHLHLEMRLGPAGVEFDRMGYYLAESTEADKENYLRWRIGGEFRHFNPLALLTPDALP